MKPPTRISLMSSALLCYGPALFGCGDDGDGGVVVDASPDTIDAAGSDPDAMGSSNVVNCGDLPATLTEGSIGLATAQSVVICVDNGPGTAAARRCRFSNQEECGDDTIGAGRIPFHHDISSGGRATFANNLWTNMVSVQPLDDLPESTDIDFSIDDEQGATWIGQIRWEGTAWTLKSFGLE